MKKHKIVTTILAIVLFSMFINLITPNVEITDEQKQQWAQERELEEQNQEIINETEEDSQEVEKIKPVVFNSDWDGSVAQVKNYLRNNLNDWNSYESVEWSEVQEVNLTTHKYIIRHKYRANNAYGGTILVNQIFYLDEEGDVVDVKDWQ